MCGRATLRIELSTPCMMFAIMIESVIMPRLGTGTNGGTASPSQPTLPGQHNHGRQAITCSRLPLPSRGGWVVRDIEVGFVSFGKPGLRKPGALPSLHVMPIKAAYGRLPWEVPVLSFGTREPLTALAQGNLPKVLINERTTRTLLLYSGN